MDGKRPDALSDAVLDRELDAALGVEPSPEFLARVRTRLASEPALVPRRFSGAVWHLPRPWLACATAAAILIAAALALWPPLARIDPEQASTGAAAPGTPRAAAPPTQRAATASRSPRPEVLRPQPASRRTEPEVAPRVAAARGETAVDRPPFPEVLISDDEVRAFETLLAAVQGRVVPDTTPAEEQRASLELSPIEIAPVIVEPVPQIASLRVGEGQ